MKDDDLYLTADEAQRRIRQLTADVYTMSLGDPQAVTMVDAAFGGRDKANAVLAARKKRES